MAKVTQPYFRKKGKSIAIEVKVDAKSKHLKTLPNAKKLLRLYYPEEYEKYLGFMTKENPKGVPKKEEYLPEELKFLVK